MFRHYSIKYHIIWPIFLIFLMNLLLNVELLITCDLSLIKVRWPWQMLVHYVDVHIHDTYIELKDTQAPQTQNRMNEIYRN